MAIARAHEWSSFEILTASELNAEFDNIINNLASGVFPLTGTVSFGGFAITSVGDLTLSASKNIIMGSGGVLTMTAGPLRLAKGADVASAAALTPGADGNYFHVTGTTTVTSIASVAAGVRFVFEFDDAVLLTYNATSLILPTSANITTAAGDMVEFVSEGSGNWRCVNYQHRVGVTDANITTTDVTTNNATASKHGFVPKWPNNTTTFFRGDGTYAVPTGTLTAGSVLTMNPWAQSTTTTTAHGLGAEPSFYKIILECLSIDGEWQVGDRPVIKPDGIGAANSMVGQIYADSTNTYLRTSNADFTMVQKTTSGTFTITASRWKVLITPYKLN